MDAVLARVTSQAMNYAIRSGISITSAFAIQQCTRLIKTKKGHERDELGSLQARLQSKIQIISPAIDMIELITARGNTSLESAVELTKALRYDIQELGMRISKAAADEELSRRGSSKAKPAADKEVELFEIKSDMKKLLARVEDAVPLINLAITTSGVSLSTNLPASISPSRLLQASTFLSAGDAQYASRTDQSALIGPPFVLSMYMLFSGHANRAQNEEGLRHATWKEVIHKARVKLIRVALDDVRNLPNLANKALGKGLPNGTNEENNIFGSIPAARMADEFAYQLLIVEDLDDGRVHTVEDDEQQPPPFDDVESAGIREVVPIHEVSKIFYADTGKILNIGNDGETNNPVLLLKRDVNAVPPRRMIERDETEYSVSEHDYDAENLHTDKETQGVDLDASEIHAQFLRESSLDPAADKNGPDSNSQQRLPPDLDQEWIAFEVFDAGSDSDLESDDENGDSERTSSKPSQSSRQGSADPMLNSAMAKLHLNPTLSGSESLVRSPHLKSVEPSKDFLSSLQNKILPSGGASSVRTSLSLLEMLIRLTSLQQFQQASHLTINDELLNFFLEESSTTGAAPGDVEDRKRIRMDARRRVGFDPYDESPIKRRGEDYQYQEREHSEQWLGGSYVDSPSSRSTSERYESSRNSGSVRSSPFARQGTPSRGNRQSPSSLATPPGTTKSRDAFLREEAVRDSPARRSPLGKSAPWASGDGESGFEDESFKS